VFPSCENSNRRHQVVRELFGGPAVSPRARPEVPSAPDILDKSDILDILDISFRPENLQPLMSDLSGAASDRVVRASLFPSDLLRNQCGRATAAAERSARKKAKGGSLLLLGRKIPTNLRAASVPPPARRKRRQGRHGRQFLRNDRDCFLSLHEDANRDANDGEDAKVLNRTQRTQISKLLAHRLVSERAGRYGRYGRKIPGYLRAAISPKAAEPPRVDRGLTPGLGTRRPDGSTLGSGAWLMAGRLGWHNASRRSDA